MSMLENPTPFEKWMFQNAEGVETFPRDKMLEKAFNDGKKQIQIDAEQIRALQKQNGELTDKVNELEAQIEKMKCCRNCRHPKTPIDNTCVDCERFSKWELRR